MAVYTLKGPVGAHKRTLKDFNSFQKMFHQDESQEGFEFSFPGEDSTFWLPESVVEKYFHKMSKEEFEDYYSIGKDNK